MSDQSAPLSSLIIGRFLRALSLPAEIALRVMPLAAWARCGAVAVAMVAFSLVPMLFLAHHELSFAKPESKALRIFEAWTTGHLIAYSALINCAGLLTFWGVIRAGVWQAPKGHRALHRSFVIWHIMCLLAIVVIASLSSSVMLDPGEWSSLFVEFGGGWAALMWLSVSMLHIMHLRGETLESYGCDVPSHGFAPGDRALDNLRTGGETDAGSGLGFALWFRPGYPVVVIPHPNGL